MTRSILKRKPDRIEYPDGNGERTCVVADDWLLGHCNSCGGQFMVESNVGSLRCPYGCLDVKIMWMWVKHKTVYIPEHDPMIIVDGQMKKVK